MWGLDLIPNFVLNGLKLQISRSLCSEASIVLTVILTSKNEVLQIIQTWRCLFYKWTISLLSSFTSLYWESLPVARFTCYLIFPLIFLVESFPTGSDILLIIWPLEAVNTNGNNIWNGIFHHQITSVWVLTSLFSIF